MSSESLENENNEEELDGEENGENWKAFAMSFAMNHGIKIILHMILLLYHLLNGKVGLLIVDISHHSCTCGRFFGLSFACAQL